MTKDNRSVMAALCGNVLTVSVFLRVFCLSGAQTGCDKTPRLSITAPKQIEALSGSCLQIPCSFRDKPGGHKFDSSRETFGVWIKSTAEFAINPNNVIFNSSKSQNSYNIKLTGDLRQKNCTSVFSNLTTSQTDKYFFRIENEPFKATASCDPVQITVRDSPWSPRIEISADVKKKNSVTITCSALTPCPHSPPELSWNHPADSQRQIEENTDGSITAKIQQSVTLSDTHDGYNISCSARYPVDEGKHDVPNDASALVSAGSWVYLNCSIRAKYPISNFTWFNNSKHGVMKVAEGDDYRFNTTEGGAYYCEVTYKEKENSFQLLIPLISVVFMLICLVVCVWFFKFKHSSP
ncbi:sialic acid-binding Ig-like lectin 7 [Kryptolebias marmoratus]|uniref:sialic acid-binding Ig-like lectin 7 n=1 Tax=Kryptolebias marmoratus TaxID=37003 RepID=UPI0018AD07EE|nr:sialic acid-binding Ig-like lectin 7 [Kryptolebias marmoratus]